MSRKIYGVTVGTGMKPDKFLEKTGHAKDKNIHVTKEEKETWDGKLDSSKLTESINTALAQAKESGQFDGKDGQDGYTPQKGVDYFDGQDGKDGENGKDGADGKTPQKGTDYFTEADKQAFVTSVLNALPTWQGGAF